MIEKSVEDYLIARVEKGGGFTVKLNPAGRKGIPDRLVILPNGRAWFVELKRPRGGVVAALQDWWNARLRELGHHAYIVRSKEQVDAMFADG